jgi:hypothetical protein
MPHLGPGILIMLAGALVMASTGLCWICRATGDSTVMVPFSAALSRARVSDAGAGRCPGSCG